MRERIPERRWRGRQGQQSRQDAVHQRPEQGGRGRLGRSRWRAKSARKSACAAIALLLGCGAGGEPLRVAVAANFQAAFAHIAADYPQPLAPTFGSSGLLYAQIVQGRPFDAFLSADKERPQRLVAGNRAFGLSTYARGRLALLVNSGTPSERWLHDERRIAVPNPETAPYGRAAVQVLTRLTAQPRRVTALNVAQAFHFAASGAVDGAFASLAQVLAQETPEDRYWIAAEGLYDPIEQAAVVLRGGNEAAAEAFLAYLISEAAQTRIRAAGYR